jgi:hypothetical protein
VNKAIGVAGAFVAAGVALGWSGAALGQAAQPSQSQSATEQKKLFDPNEMVCEKQAIPGSRLAVAKVCHTRAEWADLRHQDRQDVERAQTQRGMQK